MAQHAQPPQLQDDEEPADPAIAVGVRMQGLELVVSEPGLDDRRHRQVLAIHPSDPGLKCDLELVAMGRGHEPGVGDRGVRRPDEHLRVTQSACVAVFPGRSPHQRPLQLAHEAGREGPVFDPFEGQAGRDNIVEDLQDGQRNLTTILDVGLEHRRERCVGPLQRTRALGFTADRRVTE
jgi:hypothetical protein